MPPALPLVASLYAGAVPLREAMPVPLQHGVSAGIGLFLALIGLRSAGVVVANVTEQGVDWVLGDTQSGRASTSHIPGQSIQTYTFAAA
jgi:xanthine/uracil/vitamin C permease (AzgA family)